MSKGEPIVSRMTSMPVAQASYAPTTQTVKPEAASGSARASRRTSRLQASSLPSMTEAATADPRMALALRIVASRGFARSPLLSRFLLHVVRETLHGRAARLSEYPIGVEVFARPRDYRTDEDNIVRNYARQLRRRLEAYFAGPGRDEPMVLEIPTGGYMPLFWERGGLEALSAASEPMAPGAEPADAEKHAAATKSESIESGAPSRNENKPPDRRANAQGRTLLLGALALWTVAVAALAVALTMSLTTRRAGAGAEASAQVSASGETPASHKLWAQLFAPGSFTSVVPSDAGFNLMEDATGSSLAVASYMQGGAQTMDLHGLNQQMQSDLRTEEFTDFASAQIAAKVMRLPEYPAHGAALRFPRDLRLDDLRDGNAILIGSVLSNPWSTLVDGRLNFAIVAREGMQGASILNRAPQPGEARRYESHWHEASHDTWGIVALERNLSGTGWILLLEGLDVAGTQSAADFVMGSSGIAKVIEKARQPDGALQPFEILLHTTSLQSHAEGVEVVAMRLGDNLAIELSYIER